MGYEGIIFALAMVAFALMYYAEKNEMFKPLWLLCLVLCFIGAFAFNYYTQSTNTNSTINYPAYSVVTSNVPLFCVGALAILTQCGTTTENTSYPAYSVTTNTITNNKEAVNPIDQNYLIEFGIGLMLVVFYIIYRTIIDSGIRAGNSFGGGKK